MNNIKSGITVFPRQPHSTQLSHDPGRICHKSRREWEKLETMATETALCGGPVMHQVRNMALHYHWVTSWTWGMTLHLASSERLMLQPSQPEMNYYCSPSAGVWMMCWIDSRHRYILERSYVIWWYCRSSHRNIRGRQYRAWLNPRTKTSPVARMM